MKLKRFVAIVISLAMVLSIVPAFSLTVGAEGTTGVIDTLGGDVLWACPDGSFNDTAIADAFSGWSSSITSGYVNVKTYSGVGNVIQYYVNGTANVTTITSPGYGDGTEEKLIIEWVLKRQNPSDLYFDFSFTDKNGTEIAFLKLDKNYTSVTGEYYMGYPAEGTDCAIVAYNNEDGSTHTVEYYVGGSVVSTVADKAGTITGFGGITSSNGRWSTAWNHIGFGNLTIGAVYPATETQVEVTATYTAGGETVKTVTGKYDSTTATGLALAEYYYRASGTNVLYYAPEQELSATGTIEMSPVTNWGNYTTGSAITVDGTPYVTTGGNIVPNGDFEHGMNGWYSRANTTPPTNYSISTSDKPDSATRAAVSSGNGGASSTNSIKQAWDITPGTTYYYSLWVKAGDQWHGLGQSDSATTESLDIIGNGGFGTSSAWVQKTGVFTATKEYLVFFEGWGSVGLADVEVYPVEIDSSKIANTTIKFVDSSDGTTEIATSTTVTGVVGDVIDLTNTTLVPSTITYNGNPYSLDSTNPTSYTVVGNTDTVTLTYTTDAFVSFTADAITVIEGNDPIMPTTVTAVTGAGATTTVSGATWSGYTGLSVGTHTINGTVTIEGNEVSGSTTVTVLSETFAPGDLAANGTITFPVNVTGDFYIEYDLTASDYDNLWIYHSADSNLWGAGQIGLGWDADGNGYFRAQPVAQTDIQFEKNKTYRFFIHGNVDTDKYSLTVYDTVTTGVVFTCTDYAFRAAADYINTIVMTNNGGGNTGSAALSNVKVYAPDQASQFVTVTFTATGSVSDTYTVKCTGAETLPIPHYDGHIMKSRTVSGNTVTATYEATTASIGSWYMRNNFTDDNWLSQSKYIGAHNAFADKSSVFTNEGGALFGDSGASSSSSTVIGNSRTQTADALTQLNSGVRYFDIRLSRQENGTFATVHGPAFENFRDVAITIAQWCKENPGEVIILDFQTTRDALYGGSADGHYEVITDNDSQYGASKGDDNAYVYAALVELLKDTGLTEYMTTSWDKKYGEITSSGTKAVILPFAKGRAVNCQGSYFINRSALNGGTTYTEESSYSSIVSYLDSTYSSLTDGATISQIHAYTTPTSLFGTGNTLVSAAQSNNPNWINETNFYNWMAYGKGDIFMMNDVVSNIDTYYTALNKFNRTGSAYSYTADFTRTDNNVTITGAQTNVPFSTKWTVGATSSTNAYTISDVTYTAKTAYELDLMQFNTDSVQPTGDVTLTFPKASTDNTTVDVLLSSDGTTVLAEAAVGEAISYTTSSLSDVILATKVAPGVNMTVNYVTTDGETLYTDAREFIIGTEAYNVAASARQYLVLGGKAYIVGAEAQSYTVTDADEGAVKTVTLTLIERYAVLEDMLVDNDNNVWGINATNSNSIFVASAGNADRNDPATDDDGVSVTDAGKTPATLGGNRNGYLQFPVVSLADGEAAIANFYVRTWHGNGFANGNTTLRISGTAINDDSWTTLTDGATYTDTAAPRFTGYTKYMFTNASTNTAQYIQMDVTEMMKAAANAGLSTITIRLGAAYGAAYIAEREACVAGGTYEGNASYIDVVSANTVTVTGATKVTKMGTLLDTADSYVVPTGETIKVYTTAAYVTDDTNVYTVTDGVVTIAPDTDADYRPASVGVAMVDGAQVRIGDGVDKDGKVSTGSGLRFITTVNATDSLATVTGATFGVEITAEGNTTTTVDIPAEKWQVADSVYTSALTNLEVTNYNRNFTATPYVSIGGTKYYGTPVTRSIYKVAAGLLANGYTTDNGTASDPEDHTGEMPEVLVNVLNAYVNQTGIRLAFADSTLTARTTGTGAYTGDAFFNVSETTVDGTTYTVTLTPVGNAKLNTNYWSEYVRINNNNSKVKVATQLTDNGDGTYTLTFDTAQIQ
ncbi:MAG: hypothetical protein ACI3XA_05590 [Clostridia bacterium]